MLIAIMTSNAIPIAKFELDEVHGIDLRPAAARRRNAGSEQIR
jgi:hypothetical protein